MKTKSPTQSKGKKVVVKAWAEIDGETAEILQLFIGKPNYRYENTYEDSKLIQVQISYHLPKKSLSATKDK